LIGMQIAASSHLLPKSFSRKETRKAEKNLIVLEFTQH